MAENRSKCPDIFRLREITPRQNPSNNLDVNDDTFVTNLDVLQIINKINSDDFGAAPMIGEAPASFVDTSGDGFLSPLDTLLVLNCLNFGTCGASGEGEGESSSPSLTLLVANAATPRIDTSDTSLETNAGGVKRSSGDDELSQELIDDERRATLLDASESVFTGDIRRLTQRDASDDLLESLEASDSPAHIQLVEELFSS